MCHLSSPTAITLIWQARRLSRGSAAVKKAVLPSFAVPPGFAVLESIYEVASRQAACCGGKTLEIEVIVLIFIDNLLVLIGQLESAFPYKQIHRPLK